jgi:hypothetical protein
LFLKTCSKLTANKIKIKKGKIIMATVATQTQGQTQGTTTPPADLVQNGGSGTGAIIGATIILAANIAFQVLINNLVTIAAKWATMLADDENAIQNQLTALQQAAWGDGSTTGPTSGYQMAKVEQDLQNNPSSSTLQWCQTMMNGYSTALGLDQSSVQAGVKGIDPVETTVQSQPQSLEQAGNEEQSEAGTAIQNGSFLASLIKAM